MGSDACRESNKKSGGVVPEAGLEPAQYFYRGILSPLRLPISPLRLKGK